MNWNIHTHTIRCGHAEGEEREYAETAIREGMDTLGFADHAPMPFRGGYVSNMRMLPAQLPDYVETLLRLREQYADRLNILIGLEAEYYPSLFSDFLELIRPYPIDYLILGQHFVYDEVDTPHIYYDPVSEEVLTVYVDQICSGIRTGLMTYVAHPEMINFNDGDPVFWEKQMRRICVTAKEMDVPLEINVNGMFGHRHYPNPAFWSIAAEIGNTCVIGADAHCPDALARHETQAACRSLAQACGVRLVERVPIRHLHF